MVKSEFTDVGIAEMTTDPLDVVRDEIARNPATILLTLLARTLCPHEAELGAWLYLHERAFLVAHLSCSNG